MSGQGCYCDQCNCAARKAEIERLREAIQKSLNDIDRCIADHSREHDVCCCLNGADDYLQATLRGDTP